MAAVGNFTKMLLRLSGTAAAANHMRLTAATAATTASVRCFSKTGILDATAARRYTDKHEWIAVDGTVGIVGISKYAQEALGDIVFAQLPDPGTKLKQHDECGALESVKAASEVYSPVSGQVTEKNAAVEETPALVNTDCYEKGWLFKVNLTNPGEIDKLMSEQEYAEFLKSAVEH